MRRPINLRQIEALRAVVEAGTVSGAAVLLRISQPAVSKLLTHLEQDTEIKLFERGHGRISPTTKGRRLYEESTRIFAGVGQIERAVELIRREDQGQLLIGVLPALAGRFVQLTTRSFLRSKPGTFLSVLVRDSRTLVDLLAARQVDVAIISGRISTPALQFHLLAPHELVCVLPPKHVLARRRQLRPRDLDGHPFLAFAAQSLRLDTDVFLAQHGVQPKIVLEATNAQTLCECAIAGLGLALMHPLMALEWLDRLVVRRLQPSPMESFAIAIDPAGRNSELAGLFRHLARLTAERELARIT